MGIYHCDKAWLKMLLEQIVEEASLDGFHRDEDGKNLTPPTAMTEAIMKFSDDYDFCRKLSIDQKTIRKFNLNGVYASQMNRFMSHLQKSGENQCCLRLNEYNVSNCYSTSAYIDMIAFKAYNDYLSEEAGDAIIAYFANYLTQEMESKGFLVTRKGGEEFDAFYMENVCCELPPSVINKDKEQLKDYVRKIKKEFQAKEICLFYPKATDDPFLLWHDKANQDKAYYNDGYRFRVMVRGMDFRYGVDSGPEKACERGQEAKKKEDPKPRRGDFALTVRIGVNPDSSDNDDGWYDPKSHIFLFLTSESMETREAIYNKLRTLFGDSCVARHYDKVYSVTSVVIKFNPESSDRRDRKTLMEALKSASENERDSSIKELMLLVSSELTKRDNTGTSDIEKILLYHSLKQFGEDLLKMTNQRSNADDFIALAIDGYKNDKVTLQDRLNLLLKERKYDSREDFLRRSIELVKTALPDDCESIYTLSGASVKGRY